MPTYQLKKCLTGKSFRESLHKTQEEREALIEGLLYKKSVIMVSADPGCGKSTIVACMIAQLSSGVPVFGSLTVPKPALCYYLPFERGAEEIMERLKHIDRVIPLKDDNIIINDSFIGYNVTETHHADEIIFNIKKHCSPRYPDLIILDPIYAAVSGGLSKDDNATKFTAFSARLQAEFDCSIWMNHHTTKDSYSSRDGLKIEKEDPFYGSQWLKAHCTAAYYMRKDPVIGGVVLLNKKDSHGNLLQRIELEYDAESYTSFIPKAATYGTAHDRLLMLLRTFKSSEKPFTFKQIQGSMTGVSTSHIRELLRTPPFSKHLKKHKSIGGATLYEIEGEI